MAKYPLTEGEKIYLAKTFQYHAPKGDQPARYGVIRDQSKELAVLILENVPESPERQRALVALEQTVMYANAGIARNERTVL